MYKSIVITLSVVSIDYRIFIFSNMFGLADQSGVPGPQGADSAPSLLCSVTCSADCKVRDTSGCIATIRFIILRDTGRY